MTGGAMSEEATSDPIEGHALMLYDGLCGVPHSAVYFKIKRDHADRFRFTPQQSALAAAIFSRSGIDREAMLKSNSVYLILDAPPQRRKC